MTVTAPALPDTPACWAWELPPLPVRNHLGNVQEWQAGRCAVCGRSDHMLVEDHDHATGDTRGYLCERCNNMEGRSNPRPVFAAYQRQYPTLMLGVLQRYKAHSDHPAEKDADASWRKALGSLQLLTDEKARAEWQDGLSDFRATIVRMGGGSQFAEKLASSWDEPPQWTPLARSAHLVGWTAQEWDDTLARRMAVQLAVEVHLPVGRPPAQACRPQAPWSPPPRQGYMRRPCSKCYVLDPDRMELVIGDGHGNPAPGTTTCGVCAGSPPIGFTCNTCGAVA